MLSEIRKHVVETGIFGEDDMIPLPCNPESISIGYGLRNGDTVLPVTSLIPQQQLVDIMPNTISMERYPALREKFIDLFSLSSGPLNTSQRVSEFLCCLPQFEAPANLGYESIFRVTIVQFLDRFNFCVGNVKRSCIHFVTPELQLIPFDTYNLFYRNRLVDKFRKGVARGAEVTA